jgi:hypothetical protein
MVDAETARRELDCVLERCRAALRFGAAEAARFFKGKRSDDDLFCHLVRYFAMTSLGKSSAELQQRGAELLVDRLNNSGIELRWRSYRIRVWRAPNGMLPPPGVSQRRREFYNQLSLGLADEGEINVALLWDADEEGQLLSLWLVCPRSPMDPKSVHWRIPVHESTGAVAATLPEEEEDLPIRLRRDIDELAAGSE